MPDLLHTQRIAVTDIERFVDLRRGRLRHPSFKSVAAGSWQSTASSGPIFEVNGLARTTQYAELTMTTNSRLKVIR